MAHYAMAMLRRSQKRLSEARIAAERAVILDHNHSAALCELGLVHLYLGHPAVAIAHIEKAIRLSPRDPMLDEWYVDKASAHLGLKQYDQAIEWARRTIATSPNNWDAHRKLVAALALTGQDSEAHDALQRYLALRDDHAPKSIWELNQERAQFVNGNTDPRYVEYWDRLIEGMRKAGLPEA